MATPAPPTCGLNGDILDVMLKIGALAEGISAAGRRRRAVCDTAVKASIDFVELKGITEIGDAERGMTPMREKRLSTSRGLCNDKPLAYLCDALSASGGN